jgi:hypothetical protein
VSQLPDGWRELANKMGLVRPQPAHIGAKVIDIEQALRLVLHYVSGSSLRLTAAIGAAIDVITISSVALHKWMKRIGPYLAILLSRMVDGAAFAPEKWAGFDVIVGDATTVQRPGSKGTTARVHYALRLADLSARHTEVNCGCWTAGTAIRPASTRFANAAPTSLYDTIVAPFPYTTIRASAST